LLKLSFFHPVTKHLPARCKWSNFSGCHEVEYIAHIDSRSDQPALHGRKKIPSTYLKIYSDGTAECHTLKYWDEPDIAKTKSLPIEEFDQLKAFLEQPDLLNVKHRYERMYAVMDSWMEWTIKIKHSSGEQSFEVSGFSPSSAKASRQPYPEALTKSGCSIQKIRSEVFGYEPRRAETDCDSNTETSH